MTSFPPDLKSQDIVTIVSDLRRALDKAREECPITYSQYIYWWCVVDDWGIRVSNQYDKEWAKAHGVR